MLFDFTNLVQPMEIDEEVVNRKRKCAGDMQSSLIRRDKSLVPKKRRRFSQEDVVMAEPLSSIWQQVDIPRIIEEPCRLIRGRPQFIFPKFVFLCQEPDDHESMELEE
jgi:hypothetical protein